MINVSTAVQNAYINGNPDTKIFLTVGGTLYDPTNIRAGSVSVIESLCSAECFTLSRVEKNELTFTLINTTENIKELQGKTVVAKQTITLNGVDTDIPLGTFQITEAVNDGDYLIKCTAYDKATLAFDANIDAWWNTTLAFPVTIRNLAIALFTHLNVPYNIPATFTNSTYTLTARPVFLEGVTAAELLGYLQEVVGGYFKADRYGVIRLFSTIDAIQGLRPRVGLYPRDNLFPRRTHSTFGNPDSYKQQDYSYPQIVGDLVIADYRTAEIEKVQVRGTEDDIGIIVGTGSNTYVIQGNPLLYNLTDATGRTIVTNILNEIKNVAYIPFSGKFMALPFLEAGDCAVITTYKGITAYAPIFKRTLSGTRLCFDTFECNGTKDIEQVFATNRSVKILNQKTHEIVNTVDELSSTISSIDTEVDGLSTTVSQHTTAIQQNAEAITLRATKTEAQGYADAAEADAKAYADQIVAGTVLIFYQASAPTTGMKTGDLWIDTTNGNEMFRYNGSAWVSVQDSDIQTALTNAATAQSTADGKIKTFAQTTAPTASDVGDLWVDTDDNNKLYRWTGSAWESVRDATIAAANTLAQNALNTANGKSTTYYQASAPANASDGDLWIDTDDGNSLHRWSGTAWVDVDNADLATALQDAADAQATADSKIVTYAQTTAPTDGTVGDLWIDTDDNNTLYRHNGTAWVSVKDASIAAANSLAQSALNAANSKITTYYQAASPATANTGDLWIDTDDSNKLYRYDGTNWVSVQDGGIQAALTAAGTAQATADGKIVTFAQSTQPTATDIGDLWIDTGTNNKMYRWDGTTWNSTLTGNSIVSLINLDSSGVQISGSKVNIDTSTLNLTFGSQASSVTIQSTTNNDGVLFTGNGKVNFETNGEFYAKNYDSSDHIVNEIQLASGQTDSSQNIYNLIRIRNRYNDLTANSILEEAYASKSNLWLINNRPGVQKNANYHYMGATGSEYVNRLYNYAFNVLTTGGSPKNANYLILNSDSSKNSLSFGNICHGIGGDSAYNANFIELKSNDYDSTHVTNSATISNYRDGYKANIVELYGHSSETHLILKNYKYTSGSTEINYISMKSDSTDNTLKIHNESSDNGTQEIIMNENGLEIRSTNDIFLNPVSNDSHLKVWSTIGGGGTSGGYVSGLTGLYTISGHTYTFAHGLLVGWA